MSATAAAALRRAVEQEQHRGKAWTLQRIFSWWFQGFVYNQIWEDPRVDLEALSPKSGERMVAISSAGCNLFNYLAHAPLTITAVDLNPAHMRLTRLKIAAIKGLPDYRLFYNFFARGDSEENIDNYYRYIRRYLRTDCRDFWESGPLGRLRAPRINWFAKGFYDISRSALFIRFLHALCRFAGCDPSLVLHARSQAEQEQLYEKHLAPAFKHWIVRNLGRLPIMLYSLGIPPQQHELLSEEKNGDLATLFAERVRRLACAFPLSDNYFAWQAFARRYSAQGKALPEYLRAGNFELLKERVLRLDTRIGSVTDLLTISKSASYDHYVMLDAQDWMSRDSLNELWREILRTARPGARVIFRTAGESSPLEDLLTADLRKRFNYERDLSKLCFDRDRAAIYGGFHLYRLN